MTNLVKLESKSDVKEAIDQVQSVADDLDMVMILAIDKSGKQHLWTSTGSMLQKSFLVQFLNAWAAKWFGLEDA